MARQAKAARHSIKQTAGALKAGAHQWWLMHINHGSGSQVQPSSSHAQWRALQVDTDLNQWRLLQDDRHKGFKPQSRPCWCYPLLMLTHTRHARAHSTKALCSPAPAPATASPAPATASPATATCHQLLPPPHLPPATASPPKPYCCSPWWPQPLLLPLLLPFSPPLPLPARSGPHLPPPPRSRGRCWRQEGQRFQKQRRLW